MELSHPDNHDLQELDYKTQLFQDKNNNKVSYKCPILYSMDSF